MRLTCVCMAWANRPWVAADERLLFQWLSQGYVLLKQWLSPSLTGVLQSELEVGLRAQYPETDVHSQWMWSRASALPASLTPTLAKIQELPEFLVPATQVLGEGLLGIGADLNRYIGDVDWHPDGKGPTEEWGLNAAKFMVYLDPVSADTGSLHILPATHLLLGEARDHFAKGITVSKFSDVPGTALETNPGDLIIFNIHAWHGSTGGGSNRRIINLDYFAAPETINAKSSLRQLGKTHAAGRDKPVLRRWPFNYSKEWLSNPERSRVRAKWIRQLRDLETYFDGPHVTEGNELQPEDERVERAQARRLAARPTAVSERALL